MNIIVTLFLAFIGQVFLLCMDWIPGCDLHEDSSSAGISPISVEVVGNLSGSGELAKPKTIILL